MTDKKIKLSQQMRLCILTIRQGARISCTRFKERGLYLGGGKMNEATFDALYDRGLIEYDQADNWNNYYKLTELGKTIEL